MRLWSARKALAFLFLAAVMVHGLGKSALAGPPFATDDPDPVDYSHWEIYTFAQGTHVRGDTAGAAPAMEVNYGAFPGVHLHVLGQLAYDKTAGEDTNYGLGDMELGAKIRFVNADDNSLGIKLATFPALDIPTGDSDEHLGTGHARIYAPLWLGKDFGDWTTYGGGGYWRNRGRGDEDYWFLGWALQNRLSDNLSLGGEIFYQTASEVNSTDTTGFNFGVIYDLNDSNHLLLSAGRGIQHASESNEFSYYVGYQITF